MAKKSKRGRKKGFKPRRILSDRATRAKVLALLQAGDSRNDVAKLLGFSYQTLLNEEDGDPEFALQIAHAEAMGKQALLGLLRKGAKKDPKWAAWMLERKYWQEYARRNPEAITPEFFVTTIGRIMSALLAKVPVEFHDAIRSEIDVILASLTIAKG